MPLDLDTSLLRTLVAIADVHNFSRAAVQLNITQSAVTLRIQKLEHLVRKPLVRRSRSGVALTEDGSILADYARKILLMNDQALEHIAHKHAPEQVAVGVIEEFAKFFLEDFLNHFHRQYPRVRIDVMVDYSRNLRRMLDEDRIRLAILKRDFAPGTGELLYRDPLVWVGASWFEINPSRAIPLVISPEPCVNRAVMIEALDAAGMPWTVVSSSPTLSGVVAAVNAGLGVSAIDRRTIQPSMRVFGPADGMPPLPESQISLIRRPGASERLLDNLVRGLKRFISSHDDVSFVTRENEAGSAVEPRRMARVDG